LLCAVVMVAVTGCSGINVSKSVSPLDFILPGLLQTDPPPEHPDRSAPGEAGLVKQIAQN
jgi:hypothetical protein